MIKRYIRSLDTVTKEELKTVQSQKIGVIGSGGLGGYVLEMLARFGVGYIRVIDGDVFDETNLNRQLLSTEANLGLWKVDIAKSHVKEINSNVYVDIVKEKISAENASEYLKDLNIVIDCVDNIKTRLIIEKTATELNIPMVHGAVGAWFGQVISILPGDNILEELYANDDISMKPISAAAFIPGIVASYQVAECIKLLTGKGEILRNKMMYFDLLNNNNFVVDLIEDE